MILDADSGWWWGAEHERLSLEHELVDLVEPALDEEPAALSRERLGQHLERGQVRAVVTTHLGRLKEVRSSDKVIRYVLRGC